MPVLIYEAQWSVPIHLGRLVEMNRHKHVYHISADSERRCLRGAMRESPRDLFPVAGKPSAGSSLLPMRRNKILRESNFAEKSKFSPSNSFCAVLTDSDGTPRDASTRGREGGVRGVEGTWRRPISKTGPLILPEEAPHFEHRRWWVEGWD